MNPNFCNFFVQFEYVFFVRNNLIFLKNLQFRIGCWIRLDFFFQLLSQAKRICMLIINHSNTYTQVKVSTGRTVNDLVFLHSLPRNHAQIFEISSKASLEFDISQIYYYYFTSWLGHTCCPTQRPRIYLNKRFLPRPNTTTA